MFYNTLAIISILFSFYFSTFKNKYEISNMFLLMAVLSLLIKIIEIIK